MGNSRAVEARGGPENADLRLAARVFALSIAAAVIIEYLLYRVYLEGASSVFAPPTSLLFLPLIAIAALVYHYLKGFVVHARKPVSTLLPLGIAGALLAFALTMPEETRFASMVLISCVYLAELAVGVKLYYDISWISRAGALMFVAGMVAFIATLPITIYINTAALAPMAFNAVKAAGLAVLLYRALEKMNMTMQGRRGREAALERVVTRQALNSSGYGLPVEA